MNYVDINEDIMNKVYLHKAYQYAESKSRDTSTQNAAILLHPNPSVGVIAQEVNGLPHRIKETEDIWNSSKKYHYVEHAERNVIYKAASKGLITTDLVMYCPWICCSDCARAIIQAGIKKVIGHQDIIDKTPERWKESCNIGLSMLREAGIQVGMWKGNVCDGKVQILFNKELISP